jgi:hypothetical protein
MHVRIAGNDRSEPRPVPRPRHQAGAYRVVEDVKTRGRERPTLAFLFAQDRVVSLLLQPDRWSGR